jgi:hypothetical protein
MQERHGDRGLDLSALASVELYRRNAFRLSGLPVDATLRQLRRRSQEIEAAARLGDDDLITGDPLYPVRPRPPAEEVLTALQRIRDPNQRLLDEWFWLWPIPDIDVEGANPGEVRAAWSDMVGTGRAHASTAVHNLAITSHLKALEAGKSSKSVEGTWNRAYRRWRQVLRDERCWEWLEHRVEAIADPQLKVGAVAELRRELPSLLLEIHAELTVSEAGQPSRAKLHVNAMRASGFDRELIDQALIGAVQSHVYRLRSHGERAREAAMAREPYEPVVRSIVEETTKDLDVLDAVVGRSHPVASGVADRLAGGLRECVIAGINRSGAEGSNRPADYAQAVRCLGRAKTIAGKGHVGQQIDADIVTLLTNQVVLSCNAALEKPKGAKTYTLDAPRRLLKETREPMNRLRKLDSAAHDSLCDDVAGTSFVMLIDYVDHHRRGGGDLSAVLPALRQALELAKNPELASRIDEAIRDIESLVNAVAYDHGPRNRWPGDTGLGDPFGPPRRHDDDAFRFPGIGSPTGRSATVTCAFCGALDSYRSVLRPVMLARMRPYGENRVETRVVEVTACGRCRGKRLALVPLQLGILLLYAAAIVTLVLVAFMDSLTLWTALYWLGPMGILVYLMRWAVQTRVGRHRMLGTTPEIAALMRENWRVVR